MKTSASVSFPVRIFSHSFFIDLFGNWNSDAMFWVMSSHQSSPIHIFKLYFSCQVHAETKSNIPVVTMTWKWRESFLSRHSVYHHSKDKLDVNWKENIFRGRMSKIQWKGCWKGRIFQFVHQMNVSNWDEVGVSECVYVGVWNVEIERERDSGRSCIEIGWRWRKPWVTSWRRGWRKGVTWSLSSQVLLLWSSQVFQSMCDQWWRRKR